MSREDTAGMVDLKHVANVPWCVRHNSFGLNFPTESDGGSCVAWELLSSEVTNPGELDLDCDFTTARVLIPVSA